jgi:hypothetical protein
MPAIHDAHEAPQKSNGLIALIPTASSTSPSSSETACPALNVTRDAIAVRIAQPVQAMLSTRTHRSYHLPAPWGDAR